jgi:hypothetical protein
MECSVCQSVKIRKYGTITRTVMTKEGKKKKVLQKYQCENGHVFRQQQKDFDDSFIEHVVYVYLRCLSLNTTIDIIREEYETDILSKGLILRFIEIVADKLPTIDDIDGLYHPIRSGYLAFDGLWFEFNGEEIVLLVCFDPETFDIVSAIWSKDENQEGYENLITQAVNKIGVVNVKGIYGDGDNGLLQGLKHLIPTVPFQLCVFHKELRMGQVVPVKSVKVSKRLTPYQRHDIKVFQFLFREVIYARSKDESVKALDRLKQYARSIQNEKFLKAYRSLIHNFKYTLTHFDYPHMRRDNNLIECFNSCLKPRLSLMKGFKKKENLDRYLKLFLLEFRFHPLKESRFKERQGNSPLEITGVFLPKYYNFIRFLRNELGFSY